MKSFLLSTALACLIVATPALAVSMVGTVDVNINLPAVTNKAAAARFAHISEDLKGAIAALLVDRLAPDGLKVTIAISEVELSNSFTDTAGIADTKLVGLVHMDDPKTNNSFDSYTLTVDVNNAKTFLPVTVDMTTLKASSDEYYRAMIQAFAKAVVEKLPA